MRPISPARLHLAILLSMPLVSFCHSQISPRDHAVSVSDRYIVTLRGGIDISNHIEHMQDLHARSDTSVFSGPSHYYNMSEFQGYAGHFSKEVITAIADHEDVLAIEADKQYKLGALTEQRFASYGLNLVSHKKTKSKDKSPYVYDDSAGVGTYAYVVDTGINVQHVQFDGRATWGYNAVAGSPDTDTHGHGTHMAGIIGSQLYGVAKRTNLIAVKVSGNGGLNLAAAMDGFQWAARDIRQKRRQNIAVINVSIYGERSPAFNRLVDAAYAGAITTITCSGNDAADVQLISPASAEGAIAVGAADWNRVRTSFSNWGPKVAMFAPGVEITSTWTGSRTATYTGDGTSCASAYVAGVLLYFQRRIGVPNAKAAAHLLARSAMQNTNGNLKGSSKAFVYNMSGK